jgi:hypothetical protein
MEAGEGRRVRNGTVGQEEEEEQEEADSISGGRKSCPETPPWNLWRGR